VEVLVKEHKVLAFKYLPSRIPIGGTAILYLLLDRPHIPGWAKGACWAIMALIWIACIVGIWNEKHVSPEELLKP